VVSLWLLAPGNPLSVSPTLTLPSFGHSSFIRFCRSTHEQAIQVAKTVTTARSWGRYKRASFLNGSGEGSDRGSSIASRRCTDYTET